MANDLRTSKIEEFQNALVIRQKEIEQRLPSYLDKTRFMALARTITKNTEILMNCSMESIISCVLDAAERGLEIGGPNKHCAIVKFKTTAVLITQWQGKSFLWTRSGAITKLSAGVIYKGDKYLVEMGDNERIEHQPDVETDHDSAWLNNFDNMVGAYAIATLPSGEKKHSFVTRSEILRVQEWVKKKNEGKLGFGWTDWRPEMARKTAVHRLDGFIQPPPDMTETQVEAWSRAQATVETDARLLDDEQEQLEHQEPGATPTAKPSTAEPRDAKGIGADGSKTGVSEGRESAAGASASQPKTQRVVPKEPEAVVRVVPEENAEAEGTGTNASHAASDRKLTMAEARELADETGKMLNFRQQTTVLREFKADSYEDLTQGNWRAFIARVQQVAEGK